MNKAFKNFNNEKYLLIRFYSIIIFYIIVFCNK